MITLCIPTLNRYDLLPLCIESAMRGTMKPNSIHIVDNGKRYGAVDYGIPLTVHTPEENMGVAGSWNYFINYAWGDRIIVNDDIQFCEDTIERMVNKLHEGNEFVWTCRPYGVLNGFSCFTLADSLIEKIGAFDETISPNYAYFEDNDFIRRMTLAGISPVESEAEAIHACSSTLHAFDQQQLREHNRKFELARNNYVKKWGGLPGQETFMMPYGK